MPIIAMTTSNSKIVMPAAPRDPTLSPVQGTRMHDYAMTNLAVARNRINLRLFIPKLLFLPAILFAIVSQHVYVEDGFWDTTWEVLAYLILMIAAIGRVWTS